MTGRLGASTWAGIVLGIVFLTLLGYTQRDRFLTGRNDFVQLYAGAQLSGTTELYEPAASRAVHRQVLGVELESVYYSRPPFYAFFLRPLGKLPYLTAYWTFEALMVLAFVAFLWLWLPGAPELALFASLCLPLLSSLLAGQDVMLALLAASLSIAAMRRGNNFAAGLLLSVCAIKIHLFALTPIPLLIHRRWTVIAGGAAGGVALAAVSFLSDGWSWPQRYLELLSNPELHPGAEHMPSLRGLVFSLMGTEPAWLITLLSVVVVGLVGVICWRVSLELGFAMALIGGLLTGYHAYLQDCSILLLSFVLVLQSTKAPALRGAIALALTPPLYIFLLAGQPYSAVVSLSFLGILVLGLARPYAVSTVQ